MLAQGLPPYEAAVCGAYLHGHAGLIVHRDVSIAGVVARDLISRLPEALRHLYLAAENKRSWKPTESTSSFIHLVGIPRGSYAAAGLLILA